MLHKHTLFTVLSSIILLTQQTHAITTTENDINTLNFGLALEHLEAYFYSKGQSVFSAADFEAAGYSSTQYQLLGVIAEQEASHVALLTSAIQSLGGTPVQACNSYTYGVNSVQSYLAVAHVLESTGVSAYDGALNTLTSPSLQQTGATIATVEARHASFLSLLTNNIPFPNVTDPILTPTQIFNDISGIIAQCNNNAALPQALPVVRTQATPNHTETNNELQNDIAVLQYALTLENLEASFYNQYASITSQQFVAAGYPSNTADYVSLVRQHENDHVSILQQVLQKLGQTPVPACTYNFPTSMTAQNFISAAAALENTGVSAYDGAANAITNTGIQEVAATIATVEGRHAAYFNNLLQQSPFPNVTDVANTPQTVASIASQFITSCPYDLNAAISNVKTGYSGQDNGSNTPQSGSGNSGSGSGSTSGTSGSGSGTTTSGSSNTSSTGFTVQVSMGLITILGTMMYLVM